MLNAGEGRLSTVRRSKRLVDRNAADAADIDVKVTDGDVNAVIAEDNVNLLRRWFRHGKMNFGHIKRYRDPRTKDTMVHRAARQGSERVLTWLLNGHVDARYLERENASGFTALDVAQMELKRARDRQHDFLSEYTTPGDSFEDSISYASGNYQRKKMGPDYHAEKKMWEKEIARRKRIVSLLEHAISKPTPFVGDLVQVALKHGSLMGVQKIEQHFPGSLNQAHEEEAASLKHPHIAEFVASVISNK